MENLNLQPGEVHEPGDLLIFTSQRDRDIFYNPPPGRERCPLTFDSLEDEARFHHPEWFQESQSPPPPATAPAEAVEAEVVDLAAEGTGQRLFNELVRREGGEVEELPEAEIISPPGGYPAVPLPYPQTALQWNGDFYFAYQREPIASEKPATAAFEANRPPAPKPMDMAEKLAKMERFVNFERNLYLYDRLKGIYVQIDRDDTKGLIVSRLAEDLRIRGTANQIRDVYEFLRLDKSLEIQEGPPKHLLAFMNGVLDLRTGKFTLGHSPDVFLNRRLEVPYMPEERDCPHFKSVLRRISGGDPAFVERVLEVMAFLLVPSTFSKGLVLFQGLGDTGKTTVAKLIASYLDDALVSHVPAQRLDDRFSAATLQGRRLNSSDDLPAGKIGAGAISLLKGITGGDTIFVESKGQDGHSAHIECRFLFGTNHAFAPVTRDDAFIDRIILVPFRYPIPPMEQDTTIDDKLFAERAAIFNLVLDAFYRWQSNHYRFTGEDVYGIRVAGLGDSESDPMVTAFIRECCTLDPSAYVPTATLFEAYGRFLADHSCPLTVNTQQFSRLFNEATPSGVFIKKIRHENVPTNCYVGIELKGEKYAKK